MNVSQRARNHLKESLSKIRSAPDSDSCFRMVKDGDQLRIEVDVPGETDEVFGAEGDPVLAVAPEIIDQCAGLTLDVDTSKDSAQLVLIPTPATN